MDEVWKLHEFPDGMRWSELVIDTQLETVPASAIVAERVIRPKRRAPRKRFLCAKGVGFVLPGHA